MRFFEKIYFDDKIDYRVFFINIKSREYSKWDSLKE